jgi:hypothetical protein
VKYGKDFQKKMVKYNNKELAEIFVEASVREAEGSNMFIRGNVLYSYGEHFPLAIRLWANDTDENSVPFFLVNKGTYSQTTTRHQTLVIKALVKNNIPVDRILGKKTQELVKMARMGITSLKEMLAQRIEGEQ